VFFVSAGRHSLVSVGRHRRHPASRPGYWLPVLLVVAVCLAACSTPPTVAKLEPAQGHPHDVVHITGSDLEDAQIVWDFGKTTQKVIPGGYQSAYMFSVPHGAPAGAHPIVLQKNGVQSKPITFTVPSATGLRNVPRPPGGMIAYPAPRIDAVTIVGATFEPAGVKTTLYLQGANLDVGAVVSITDDMSDPPVPVATASHKVLRNEWFGVYDDQFDYPIYHYGSTVAIAGLRPAGQRIWLIVTNLDGLHSQPFQYDLPNGTNTIDSDGDSLRDVWETAGYDAEGDGVIDVDLPGLGADPYRRDVFVELDIMDTIKSPHDETVFAPLRQMFESAPILNFGNANGIHLVIDASGQPCLIDPGGSEVCEFWMTHFDIGNQIPAGEPDPFKGEFAEVRFSMLKARNFDKRRGEIYHYGIWGREQGNGRSGFSDMGDDFVLTFDEIGPTYYTPRSGIEALAHELGHNLGLRHAGDEDDPNMKPNYLGVMSYNWLFRTAWDPSVRLARATCLPFYYADASAKEMSGSPFPNVNTIVDYSQGMAKALDRPIPPTVTGSAAICGTTVDWTTIDTIFNTVKDFGNWGSVVFTGPSKNGTLQP
jgi:hypothetical protein